MPRRPLSLLMLALIGVFASVVSAADLRLHRHFTDHMVLQRGKPVVITGVAGKGDGVTVTFGGQTKTAEANDEGQWSVSLAPMPANAEGRALVARLAEGDESVTLANVVVGEVWLFGRQTYVDIALGRNAEGRAAAANYGQPDGLFRALRIETKPALNPRQDLAEGSGSGWMRVDSVNALALSGAAFHLGKDLVRTLDVPVGIIDVDMGPYFGIGWMSDKAIADSATMHPTGKDIHWLPEWMREKAEARISGEAQQELDDYYENKGKGRGPKPSLGLHPLKNPMMPSAGYNAVINPLKGMALKGILLQLGNDYPFIAYRELEKQGKSGVKVELDAAWGENYPILKNGYKVTPATLPYVPQDWRRAFEDENLPIGLVLPPSSDLDVYAAHNREIRELHRRTAEQQGGIGLILPGMGNIDESGQPADDTLLAQRCKHWVLGAVYDLPGVVPTGPVLDRVETRLNKATVHFKEGTAEGLNATGDALAHFETAGPDRQFSPAKATIDGTTIKLKSEGPVQFVRFNWSERPDPGLVNSAGLPALPFSTDRDWEFVWWILPAQKNLPEEYSRTADEWSKSDVAIINGQIDSIGTGDSQKIPLRPGPLGLVASPFGPNIYVIGTDPGSPADGKLLPGDVIYGVNGKVFSDGPGAAADQQYKDLAAAITHSESEEGQGKLVFSLRRGPKLVDVELQLEVLGSYSSTTPYYCEKSQKIVANAEEWISKRYRPDAGTASEPRGFLNTDLLFLLASGNPEHQGLVRRAVYSIMEDMAPLRPAEQGVSKKPWHTGHGALLLGEYYHATGDRNVLPYLKNLADWAAVSQLKPPEETIAGVEAAQSEEQVGGWRHNYPTAPHRWKSGYGLLPHAGMACVMGMQLAKEAGLHIDELALKRGLRHFNKGRAEYGFVLYAYSGVRRDGPPPVNPEAEANGMLWSMNGKLGMAAALFDMVDDKDTVEICARHCVYGFNNTRHGHGGMFFNNFWTPVGAWAGGERGFKHFMKGQTWWRELFRRYDGAFKQAGRGGIGVAYGLPYVAPKQRLRMLGAPVSAFGPNCPEALKPALALFKDRDYARCEALVQELMGTALPAEDVRVTQHLLAALQTVRASIEHDLTLVEQLIEQDKYYYASLEVPQLKGVVAAENPRLQAIVDTLESPDGRAKVKQQQSLRENEEREKNAEAKQSRAPEKPGKWITLIEKREEDRAGDPWRMDIVEHISHAPENWAAEGFEDGDWTEGSLPLSWCPYHTALFRNTFTVEDKNAIDALRVRGRFFQQANVVIYLNGEVVAKIDEIGRGTATINAPLTDYAMELLREGENTVAVSSRHKRRWGPFRGKYKTAATVWFEVQAREGE